MKKFKNYARQHWYEITMAVLITAITLAVYKYCHILATIERNGVEAVGGELAAFLIPVFAVPVVKRIAKGGEK